jgi:hypothetical protein
LHLNPSSFWNFWGVEVIPSLGCSQWLELMLPLLFSDQRKAFLPSLLPSKTKIFKKFRQVKEYMESGGICGRLERHFDSHDCSLYVSD